MSSGKSSPSPPLDPTSPDLGLDLDSPSATSPQSASAPLLGAKQKPTSILLPPNYHQTHHRDSALKPQFILGSGSNSDVHTDDFDDNNDALPSASSTGVSTHAAKQQALRNRGYGLNPNAAPLTPAGHSLASSTGLISPGLEHEQLGWLRWLVDVQIEKHGKRRLLISILFYLVCGWVNIVFCNVADLRRAELVKRGIPATAVLPDLAHDIIPHIVIPHLPDYFILTLALLTLALVLTHKHRLGLIRRFLYVHGTLLLFRSLTIVSTTLPDPQRRCAERAPKDSIFAPVNPLFPDTCGDLMFSGHSTILTLMAMLWTDYGPQRPWITRSIWFLALGGIVSLLAQRYHYLIDVIIAVNLSHRAWRWYGHLTATANLDQVDPVVAFLERRSSEHDFERALQALRDKRELVDAKVEEVKEGVAKGLELAKSRVVVELEAAKAKGRVPEAATRWLAVNTGVGGRNAPQVIAAAASAATTQVGEKEVVAVAAAAVTKAE
ncbi:PAP2 superfamily C-terminal-domain-containing protein [Catenaria anguillulae PL171]|uniref:PAP2 superfamily C-terminal-domain-containing protein n=1 Tax=Catenaria anguillulae PL171 TaxID=765915 RepID=A0A1Y2HA89_9FUNG|nr:PAP2 superfamily C-terminal-domain-containing protein [Catenaria anguillulae PL171]